MPVIENNINFVWLGGPIPQTEKSVIENWARQNPGYQVTVWVDSTLWPSKQCEQSDQLSSLAQAHQNIRYVDISQTLYDPNTLSHRLAKYLSLGPTPNYGGASDIWRMHALQQNPGIYADTDVRNLKPLPEKIIATYGIQFDGYFGVLNKDTRKYIKEEGAYGATISNDAFIIGENNLHLPVILNALEISCKKYINDLNNELFENTHRKAEMTTIHNTGPQFYVNLLKKLGVCEDNIYRGDNSYRMDRDYLIDPEYFDTTISAASWLDTSDDIRKLPTKKYKDKTHLISEVVERVKFEMEFFKKFIIADYLKLIFSEKAYQSFFPSEKDQIEFCRLLTQHLSKDNDVMRLIKEITSEEMVFNISDLSSVEQIKSYFDNINKKIPSTKGIVMSDSNPMPFKENPDLALKGFSFVERSNVERSYLKEKANLKEKEEDLKTFLRIAQKDHAFLIENCIPLFKDAIACGNELIVESMLSLKLAPIINMVNTGEALQIGLQGNNPLVNKMLLEFPFKLANGEIAELFAAQQHNLEIESSLDDVKQFINQGNSEKLKLFLDQLKAPEAFINNNQLFFKAFKANRLDMVDLLLNYVRYAEVVPGVSGLKFYLDNDYPSDPILFKRLLSKVRDVKEIDNRGSLLHAAIHGKRKEFILPLLEAGVDTNLCNGKGQTALHYAANGKRKEFILPLIEAGVDPNLRDEEGETALHYVARGDDEALIKKLIEHGADPALKDNTDRRAFNYLILNKRLNPSQETLDLLRPTFAKAISHSGMGFFSTNQSKVSTTSEEPAPSHSHRTPNNK